MRVDKLIVEIAIELLAHADVFFSCLGEDGADGHVGYGLFGCGKLGALLGQPFGRDDLCVGEGGGPAGEEDVVLEVGRGDVADFAAEGGELLLDGGR